MTISKLGHILRYYEFRTSTYEFGRRDTIQTATTSYPGNNYNTLPEFAVINPQQKNKTHTQKNKKQLHDDKAGGQWICFVSWKRCS